MATAPHAAIRKRVSDAYGDAVAAQLTKHGHGFALNTAAGRVLFYRRSTHLHKPSKLERGIAVHEIRRQPPGPLIVAGGSRLERELVGSRLRLKPPQPTSTSPAPNLVRI